MNRLNVVVTTHLFPSEVTTLSGPWLAEQVDALAEQVTITVLAALRRCAKRDEVRPSGAKTLYRPTKIIPGDGRAALMASAARYAWTLRRTLSGIRPRPDILHAHFGFPDAVVAAPVARDLGIPLVVTLHGDDAFYLLQRQDWLGRRIRLALGQAAAVVCVSSSMHDAVRPALPDSVPVLTIENGFDDALFRVNESPRSGGILFVGTLTPVKNVDTLLRAYAELESAPQLTIVGDGPLRESLEALAAQLGVEVHVNFLGVQSRAEVAALMKNARLLAIPSSSEGYGMVAAEALACGTPVVASRVGGLPGILAGEAAGRLVEPNSVASLRDGMVDVLALPHDPEAVAAASGSSPWSIKAREIVEMYWNVQARLNST